MPNVTTVEIGLPWPAGALGGAPMAMPAAAASARGGERAVLLLTGLALLAAMAMPVPLLTLLGVPYAAPGGSLLAKLHPATWLAALALATALLAGRGNPLAALGGMLAGQPATAFYLGTVATMTLWSALRFGPSGAAFFIDTLLMPGVYALLLARLDAAGRNRLFLLLGGVLVGNALLGIGEQLTRWRLLPYTVGDGVELVEDVFRATALGGHPLMNAALAGFGLFLAYRLRRPAARLVLCLVALAALLSFGGRTALAVNLALLLALVAVEFPGHLRRHGLGYREAMGGGMAVLLVLAVILAAVASGSIGQRILASLAWDSSAEARVKSVELFALLPWPDLLFGMSPEAIARTAARVGIRPPDAAIESFWLVLALQVGIPLTLLFALALLLLCRRLAVAGGRAVAVGLAGFVLVTSTSLSLAAKCPLLVEVVALAILAASFQPPTASAPPAPASPAPPPPPRPAAPHPFREIEP